MTIQSLQIYLPTNSNQDVKSNATVDANTSSNANKRTYREVRTMGVYLKARPILKITLAIITY